MDGPLSIGAVYHLTDRPSRRKKHPIGFTQEVAMGHPYRERHKDAEKSAAPKKSAPKTPAKKAAPKK